MTGTWGVFVCLGLFSLVSGSSKKGVCIVPDHYQCHDIDAMSNVHWWYDWAETNYYHTSHCSNHVRSGRVPMVWGWRSYDLPIHFSERPTYVLGFNEPNFHQQANLSPQDAANHWRELEKTALATGAQYLVSPAAAPGGYLQPNQWFDQFFQDCSGCKVDFIATHAYWCDADITMNYLEGLWNRYHKQIWLTEFCCPQTHSASDQLAYMKAILPRLESAHYVYRYAWFAHRISATSGWVTKSTSLVEQGSSRLTALGQYYNNF